MVGMLSIVEGVAVSEVTKVWLQNGTKIQVKHDFNGAPETTRTSGLNIRSVALYPLSYGRTVKM